MSWPHSSVLEIPKGPAQLLGVLWGSLRYLVFRNDLCYLLRVLKPAPHIPLLSLESTKRLLSESVSLGAPSKDIIYGNPFEAGTVIFIIYLSWGKCLAVFHSFHRQ